MFMFIAISKRVELTAQRLDALYTDGEKVKVIITASVYNVHNVLHICYI